MDNVNRPIGILDSGLGGLAIYRELRRQSEYENFIYYADSMYCPYGGKGTEKIQARVAEIISFLVGQQVKAIVVACNTATVEVISYFRDRYDLPIIGIEPGIKPASKISKTRKALLMATPKTLESYSVAHLKETYATDLTIIRQPCPGLVEKVEAGALECESTKELLVSFLEPVHDGSVDTIILGCTHFIFLQQVIGELVGNHVEIIEPSKPVTNQLHYRLEAESLLAMSRPVIADRFYTTSSDPIRVSTAASTLLQHLVQMEKA